MRHPVVLLFALPLLMGGSRVRAQQADPDALAKALSNPVSALISVPLQYNYDETFGEDGYRHTLNLQPVVPVSISERWNLISRTILPVIHQEDVEPGSDQTGLGDALQSIFFSPKAPTSAGVIWGVGPAALLPTGTDDLGADSWALGPTAVFLKQESDWTYGALVNHLVDIGGRVNVNRTFLQPFVAHNFGGGQTITLNTESTFDWETDQWTAPFNLTYSKVSRMGGQMVSYQAGVRGYADAPEDGPDWGLRFGFTLLFPQ